MFGIKGLRPIKFNLPSFVVMSAASASPTNGNRRTCAIIRGLAHGLMRRIQTHTAVSPPLRCSLAGTAASRRSVFTRSPAFIGISQGTTTWQSCPSPFSCRDAGHICRVRRAQYGAPSSTRRAKSFCRTTFMP